MEQIGLAIRDGRIPGLDFAGVIASNTIDAERGIRRAHELKMGIPVAVISPEDFSDSFDFGEAIIRFAHRQGATILTQNGWLPWTPDNVINYFDGSIFNQHPGPVPETANQHGTMPHQTMIEFARLSGRNEGSMVIAQRVHPQMDKGAIVGAKRVQILKGDTGKDLQARALPIEYQLQVEMLDQFVRGKLSEGPQLYHFMKSGEEALLREARSLGRKAYPDG